MRETFRQTFPIEWNGEEAAGRRVLIRVGECPSPTWWFKDIVGQERRAVEVIYGGETFYLDDRDGQGWHKVTCEGGGPHCGHSSLTCAEVIRELTDDDGGCLCAKKLGSPVPKNRHERRREAAQNRNRPHTSERVTS